MEYSITLLTYVLQCKGSKDVIKSRGQRISPSYYECGPWLLSLENMMLKKNRTKRNS